MMLSLSDETAREARRDKNYYEDTIEYENGFSEPVEPIWEEYIEPENVK